MRDSSPRSAAASSGIMCSSASRYITQSLVAASSETLRASAKEPFQGKSITLAPNDRGDLGGAVA